VVDFLNTAKDIEDLIQKEDELIFFKWLLIFVQLSDLQFVCG